MAEGRGRGTDVGSSCPLDFTPAVAAWFIPPGVAHAAWGDTAHVLVCQPPYRPAPPDLDRKFVFSSRGRLSGEIRSPFALRRARCVFFFRGTQRPPE